jgi:hypothetical protein
MAVPQEGVSMRRAKEADKLTQMSSTDTAIPGNKTEGLMYKDNEKRLLLLSMAPSLSVTPLAY